MLCFNLLYTKIKVNVFERVLLIMSFILNKIEISGERGGGVRGGGGRGA